MLLCGLHGGRREGSEMFQAALGGRDGFDEVLW